MNGLFFCSSDKYRCKVCGGSVSPLLHLEGKLRFTILGTDFLHCRLKNYRKKLINYEIIANINYITTAKKSQFLWSHNPSKHPETQKPKNPKTQNQKNPETQNKLQGSESSVRNPSPLSHQGVADINLSVSAVQVPSQNHRLLFREGLGTNEVMKHKRKV